MLFKKSGSGFTLVEVIISMALLAIMVAGTAGLVKFYQRSYNSVEEDNTGLQNANFAMQAVVSEIRHAVSVTNVSNGTSLTFTDTSNNTVQFTYDNTNNTLTRTYTVGGSSTTETVADHISAVSFTYPDSSEFINGKPVNTVTVKITVNVNNGYSFTLEDSIRPRNM